MTSERLLMVDVLATREPYERNEIAYIELISSEYNLADSMTKIMAPKQLLCVIRITKLIHPINQCVLRRSSDNNSLHHAKIFQKEKRSVETHHVSDKA